MPEEKSDADKIVAAIEALDASVSVILDRIEDQIANVAAAVWALAPAQEDEEDDD